MAGPRLSGDRGAGEPLVPKLISTLAEGYDAQRLGRDAVAGLTVAIVALPLSMAIAIASGATPAAGLYAAIVGGFLVSALGGSRFQVGGPAGAFIVLVASIIDRHGFDGLLLATAMGGAILVCVGLLRLGGLIRHVPHAVLLGFTAAIALIILASQLRDLFGLTVPGKEPSALLPKLIALAQAGGSVNLAALALALCVIAVILGLRRLNPAIPGLLVAVAAASVLSLALGLPVETIGTRFGGIPGGLGNPSLPALSQERMLMVLPDALAIAFLAGLESLLSAVVADGMSGRRHRANIELVAQGFANLASALFGGLCVTGTIARTATNIRAGATSPIAGMLHSVFLLAFLLVAAPLASHVPLAALAGVLAVVAWNMADKGEVGRVLMQRDGEAAVLATTFLLIIFVDLMVGMIAGCALAGFIALWRKRAA
ncbi:MAG: SulP family inorganic anion transporter [Bosea sp.]|jgi:SulP family sulfate permease|nr:SulP family inorganic anion transporter [Bosea sp. (in: a-proteobacteria)]